METEKEACLQAAEKPLLVNIHLLQVETSLFEISTHLVHIIRFLIFICLRFLQETTLLWGFLKTLFVGKFPTKQFLFLISLLVVNFNVCSSIVGLHFISVKPILYHEAYFLQALTYLIF